MSADERGFPPMLTKIADGPRLAARTVAGRTFGLPGASRVGAKMTTMHRDPAGGGVEVSAAEEPLEATRVDEVFDEIVERHVDGRSPWVLRILTGEEARS